MEPEVLNELLTETRHAFGSANVIRVLPPGPRVKDAPAPSRSPGSSVLLLSGPPPRMETLYLGVDQPSCGAHRSIMGWGWWLLYAGLTFGGIIIVLLIQRR